MDRLRSGFHRKTRKDSPSLPTIITDGSLSSGKTTPEPGAQQPLQVPQVPSKKNSPRSPFRSLRDLSRSHKRARSPAVPSDTQSPVSVVRESPVDRPLLSPRPSRQHAQMGNSTTQQGKAHANGATSRPVPRVPPFLNLSAQEIEAKFQELTWMERNRLMQSVTNPSPDFQWARVTGNHLKKLDRYINIQPWQNNRVKLRVPAGKQDYINASPITLPSSSRANDGLQGGKSAGSGPDRYIAMQGPKQKTADHVWRMVVEELDSPGVIVMLTETHEAQMEKCYPYFPRSSDDAPLQVNRKDEFGDGFRATVRCEAIEETEAGDAIELRKLVVRVYKRPTKTETDGESADEDGAAPGHARDESGDVKMLSPVKVRDEEVSTDDNDSDSVTVELGRPVHDSGPSHSPQPAKDDPPEEYEERIVWHFLYKKWPDFGVPAFEDLDSFFSLMRLSREKNASSTNPRIVHCSAGVGRSGTFIALEHLVREMDAGVFENWETGSDLKHKQDDNDTSSTDGHNGHLEEQEEEAATGKMDVVQPCESGGDDLIFNTVNQLREQRRHMVQADSQFLFIYQVMRKLWEDKYGVPVPTESTTPQPASGTPDDGEPAPKRLEVDPFVEE